MTLTEIIRGAASVNRAADALIRRGAGRGLLSAQIAIAMADEAHSYALNNELERGTARLLDARDQLKTARICRTIK